MAATAAAQATRRRAPSLSPTTRALYHRDMRSRLTLAALALAAPALPAQPPPPSADTTVALAVTLDRADWRYRAGDSARFHVTLLRHGRPMTDGQVVVQLGPERMPPTRVDTVAPGRGGWRVAGTMREPGLLRLTATATIDGVRHTALATAAFDPERIAASTPPPPADFAEFWDRAIAEARRVPLEPRMTRLAERSTPDVDVYHVSFQNHRAGSRIYGMLSVPTRPGKYPAMLVVPGAGVRPYFPSVATARRGVIHLAIGIHGIPVDRDSLLYNELRASALADYRFAGMEDRDAYYYKRVYLGVVRAGDFLHALPQFDGERYVVQGGSQGGGLAIVAASLDPRVDAIGVSYPALADQWGYFVGRAGGWPHTFQDTTRVKALAEKKATVLYYDAVNHARRVRVPGIYAWGYNDTVVPPTASWAAYNTITAPKESVIVPETAHFRVPEQTRRMDAWLLARLGVDRPAAERP